MQQKKTQRIPTVTFDPENPWRPVPQRPFIQKANNAIYRYGNRYNVITDKEGKTEVLDLKVNLGHNLSEGRPEPGLIRAVDLITRGREKVVVIGSKEIPLHQILLTEDDI